MRISDWSSDVCSSDLYRHDARAAAFLHPAPLWRDEGHFSAGYARRQFARRAAVSGLSDRLSAADSAWCGGWRDHRLYPGARLLCHTGAGRRRGGSDDQRVDCLLHQPVAQLGHGGGAQPAAARAAVADAVRWPNPGPDGAGMTTYRSTSQRVGRVLLIGFCTLVFAFLVLPILAVVPLSLNSGTFLVFPENGLSLRWYRVIAESPQWAHAFGNRSEEHTSELQSLMRNSYAVFCLKKKKKTQTYITKTI